MCRSAMNETGRVLIVKMSRPKVMSQEFLKILDIQMLVMESRKERTEDEYRRLLEASDFRLTRIIPTQSPYSVIEGEPA
jgi:hypothetical protein